MTCFLEKVTRSICITMANNSGGRRQDVIWLKFERTITPGKSGYIVRMNIINIENTYGFLPYILVNTHTNHSKLKIY